MMRRWVSNSWCTKSTHFGRPRAPEIIRIDPSTNEVVAEIPVGPAPSAVAAHKNYIYVTDYWDGTVVRIDPETNEVSDRTWVGGRPWQIVASVEDVWVLDQTGPIIRIPVQPRNEEPGRSWLGWLLAAGAVAVPIAAFGSHLWIRRREEPEPL
jgi:YVTN family beta-propeller protein